MPRIAAEGNFAQRAKSSASGRSHNTGADAEAFDGDILFLRPGVPAR